MVWRYGYSHKLLLKYIDQSHPVFKRCLRLERWAYRYLLLSFCCFSIHILAWLMCNVSVNWLEFVAYALAGMGLLHFLYIVVLVFVRKTHELPNAENGKRVSATANLLGNARTEFWMLLVAWVLCSAYLLSTFWGAARHNQHEDADFIVAR